MNMEDVDDIINSCGDFYYERHDWQFVMKNDESSKKSICPPKKVLTGVVYRDRLPSQWFMPINQNRCYLRDDQERHYGSYGIGQCSGKIRRYRLGS